MLSRIAIAALAAVLGLAGCAGDAAPASDGTVLSTGGLVTILPCVSAPPLAKEVTIATTVPAAFVAAAYTSPVPITVGIPFPRGELLPGKLIGLSQETSTPGQRCRRTVQTDITARWDKVSPSEADSVKWLLVDGVVQMQGGVVPQIHLDYDNASAPAPPATFSWADGFAVRIAEAGQRPTTLSPARVGSFAVVGGGLTFTAEDSDGVVESETARRSPHACRPTTPSRDSATWTLGGRDYGARFSTTRRCRRRAAPRRSPWSPRRGRRSRSC
jgi:hypothetical protein